MTHVVTAPCIKCKYTDCVTVCPVECFHEDKEMVVINPDTCIDCGACIPECPVQAIYVEEEVPDKWQSFKELNIEKSKILPILTEARTPLGPVSKDNNVDRPGNYNPDDLNKLMEESADEANKNLEKE